MAHVSDGRYRPDDGSGECVLPSFSGEDPGGHRPLSERIAPPLRGARRATCGGRVARGRLLDRRHCQLVVGADAQVVGRLRGWAPAPAGVDGTDGRAARLPARGRGAVQDSRSRGRREGRRRVRQGGTVDPSEMKGKPLDDFADLSGWTPVASGQAQLDISRDRGPGGGALRLDFDWGPAGSGPMRQVGAIEFASTAPQGGKGTLWSANLCLEDHSFRSTPAVQASSASPGHEPRFAVDRCGETSWRSEPSDEPQWFLVDFGEPREYGGLIVRWDPTTTARPFDLESSDDGTAWQTVYSAGRPDAACSYVYVPHGRSRRLRLRLHGGVDGKGIGVAEIDVRPYEFSRSLE